jgi:hypothetical protein
VKGARLPNISLAADVPRLFGHLAPLAGYRALMVLGLKTKGEKGKN